jgi:hypothetical protein
MTPKDKAFRIYELIRFDISTLKGIESLINKVAKQCALIAVNEIINSNPHSNPMNTYGFSTMAYWLEVKHEIEKL